MSGPIYNAVRHSAANAGPAPSTAVNQVSPTTSTFSGSTMASSITKRDLRDATRHRKGFAIFTSVLFFITLVFLVIIQIGSVSNVVGLRDLYFFKIDVANIVPASVPNYKLVNSLARSIGLHDFYQVGLWNFCEGYNNEGITACSKPVVMYWFNPVQIILDELLEGATITLPNEVTYYLTVVKAASNVMFGCFFASTFSSFICVILCPFAVHSRLKSIPIAFFSLLSALTTTVAACISTAMWSIFRRTIIQYASDINVVPEVNFKIFVFVWIATGCALFAAIGQIGMLCCGTSRRDIKTGRRVGRRQRTEKPMAVEENPALRRRWWGSVSN